jgi:DNA-directed RNA polymerase subunit RPC12/RpoP
MNEETNRTDVASLGVQRIAPDDYLWIKCKGCGGEVGFPANWDDPGVECPSCGLTIPVHGRILYRPVVSGLPSLAPTPQLPTTTVFPSPIQRGPSLELAGMADWTLTWGILSIVLGWTVLVPLLGLIHYLGALHLAEKEKIQVPRKALVGNILSLLFGTVQTIALIAHFYNR